MASKSQTADALSAVNAPDSVASMRGPDEALKMLAQAFEMDWDTVHAQEVSGSVAWPMGRTIWFSLFVSTALWACIVGLVWLI